MVTIDQFRALKIGDVFYRGNTRFEIISITHKGDTPQHDYWGIQTTPEAIVRASSKKSSNRRIYVGHMTFLNLRPSGIEKIVPKEKTRGTRTYKSRKDYPFVKCIDRTPLEASETNDCTVRALSYMTGESYDETHAYLKSKGRVDRKGFRCSGAYVAQGLRYIHHPYDGAKFGKLLKSGILPERCIVHTRGHVAAAINGSLHDTGRMGQNSRVYGWYTK